MGVGDFGLDKGVRRVGVGEMYDEGRVGVQMSVLDVVNEVVDDGGF